MGQVLSIGGDPTIHGPRLLDERARPDFREVYGRAAFRSERLDAAVGRIRLGGMTLGERELGSLSRIRLLVAEMNALTLASEAEALACDPGRRSRLSLLLDLLAGDRLHVRIAPLAGWSPDFSVFTPPDGPGPPEPRTVMIGPHWFERPYPHPGPALGVVLTGEPAIAAGKRFEGLWSRAHDLRRPIRSVLTDALAKAR